jgi:hypothetical protein
VGFATNLRLAFGSLIAARSCMSKPQSEENDIPFIHNDLRDHAGTMGKPLDTADAPGKADSEMAEDQAFPQVPGAQ